MSEYPKFKYHKTEKATICDGADQENAMGDSWFNSPDEAKSGKKIKKVDVLSDEGRHLQSISDRVKELNDTNIELVAKLNRAEKLIEQLKSDAYDDVNDDDDIPDDIRAQEFKAVGDKLQEAEDHIDTLQAKIDALGGGVEVSDAAASLAKANDVDISVITGTGSGGNIVKGDVQDYIDTLPKAA